MNQPLNTVAIIPLEQAGLCPQCDLVSNALGCPVCGSETLMLSKVFGQLGNARMVTADAVAQEMWD